MSIKSQIDLYYWCTPNGDKILILLEELQVNYRLIPINISRGSQHSSEFVAISPNGKIPAITIEPNGANLNLFESGAILLHLASSHNQLLGKKPEETLQWLFWQTSNFGPMAGQNHHFNSYAPQIIPYAQQRYIKETARLYGVLDARLKIQDYIVDEFSIADIACYPWVSCHVLQSIDLSDYPNVQRWYENVSVRNSVIHAKQVNAHYSKSNMRDAESMKQMFGI